MHAHSDAVSYCWFGDWIKEFPPLSMVLAKHSDSDDFRPIDICNSFNIINQWYTVNVETQKYRDMRALPGRSESQNSNEGASILGWRLKNLLYTIGSPRHCSCNPVSPLPCHIKNYARNSNLITPLISKLSVMQYWRCTKTSPFNVLNSHID